MTTLYHPKNPLTRPEVDRAWAALSDEELSKLVPLLMRAQGNIPLLGPQGARELVLSLALFLARLKGEKSYDA